MIGDKIPERALSSGGRMACIPSQEDVATEADAFDAHDGYLAQRQSLDHNARDKAHAQTFLYRQGYGLGIAQRQQRLQPRGIDSCGG